MDERNFVKVKAIAFKIVECIYDTLKDIPQENGYFYITVPKYFDEYDTTISFSKVYHFMDEETIYSVHIGDSSLTYINIERGLEHNTRFQRQLLDMVNSENFIYDELYNIASKCMQDAILKKQEEFRANMEFNNKIRKMLEGRD